MTFRVDGVSASYSQRRRSLNCGAVLGVCNHRDLGGVVHLPRYPPAPAAATTPAPESVAALLVEPVTYSTP